MQQLTHEAPREESPLRAIIADDDPFARRVVRDALQAHGIVVIAEAANGREAIELALYYRPDVVLMDVVMPDTDGIAATRRITSDAPEVRVVMLTRSEEEDLWLLGLRAGACGYLSKEVDVDEIPAALRGARSGEAVISPRLTMQLVERMRALPDSGVGMRPVKSPLTAREWEILDLLCEERSTDQIAEDLVLSTETVRSHVKNILRKLSVRSREEAVAASRRLRSPVV